MAQQHLHTLGTGPLLSIMGHFDLFWSLGEFSRFGPGTVPLGNSCTTALWETTLAMLGRSSTEAILRLVRQNFTALCLDEVHLGTGAILRLLGQQGVVKNHLGTGPLVSLMGQPGTFWSPGELSRTGPGIVPFRRRRLMALRVTTLAMLGRSSTEEL